MLDQVIKKFIVRVGADELLVGFFDDVDIAVLKVHQKRFFSMAFTKFPEGLSVPRSILCHHQLLFELGLNESHFDMVAKHLVAALKECGVKEEVINEAVSIVVPLRQVFEDGAQKSAEAQKFSNGLRGKGVMQVTK